MTINIPESMKEWKNIKKQLRWERQQVKHLVQQNVFMCNLNGGAHP